MRGEREETMDHAEAIRLNAAEKYLLGELKGELRAQYEEHFFSCAECAQEIRMGAAFMDNAKHALRSDNALREGTAAGHTGGRWWSWLRPAYALPALACLLLFVAYQNTVTIPRLKDGLSSASAPQALRSFSLIAENTRGGAPAVLRIQANMPFSVYLDIPPGKSFAYYLCQVQTEAGVAKLSVEIPSGDAKNTVQILIPGSLLQSGNYAFIIRGVGGAHTAAADGEVVRYPFRLEIEK